MTPRRATPLLAPLALLLAPLAAHGCAVWRPLDRARWEQAEAHADVFRTRLRVTRLDGARLYVEQPRWTPTHLLGVYPAGWPRAAGQDSAYVIPRDSIRRLDRLESDRRRTALYLLLAGAAVGVAVAR